MTLKLLVLAVGLLEFFFAYFAASQCVGALEINCLAGEDNRNPGERLERPTSLTRHVQACGVGDTSACNSSSHFSCLSLHFKRPYFVSSYFWFQVLYPPL